MTRHCVGGLPDRQILLMPFKDPHLEDDQDILDIIDELIDTDPYGASKVLVFRFFWSAVTNSMCFTEISGVIGDDPHTESIVDNAKAYVGANFQQFAPHGPESIASLVNTKRLTTSSWSPILAISI